MHTYLPQTETETALSQHSCHWTLMGKEEQSKKGVWDKRTKPQIGWHWIPHQQVLCGKHTNSTCANKEFNLLLETEDHYDQELGQK